MPHSIRPGEVLAGRYRLVDLLTESEGGLFWRAHDRVLERHVALHVIDAEDARAPGLLEAARRSAMVLDQRILRVLDAETRDGICYVVNEWGSGVSLDIVVSGSGPLGPRRSAWLVAEVADSIARAHAAGVAHGRLAPENVLIDKAGEVRIIGFCVEAALHGLPPDRQEIDIVDLAGLLYCSLTAKWAGASGSAVPPAPSHHGGVLRPRRVRAGVPRPLDALCDDVLHGHHHSQADTSSARGIAAYLMEFVGDPTGMQTALLGSIPKLGPDELVVLPSVPEIPVRDTSDLIPRVPAREPADAQSEEQAEAPPEEQPTATAAAPAAPEDLPTEAGMPIFDEEEDEVEWFQARRNPAPPPPPFEEPPERPLFAPEPQDGTPARRSRVPATPRSRPHGSEYWPWETSTGRGTGTGLQAVEDEEVPGRNWFRLALAIAAGVVLLLAVVVAFNLGRGKTVLGQEPEADQPQTQRSQRTIGPTAPLTGLTAADFDPQGDPPEESPEDAPLAVDGDPATAWTTSGYNDQFGPTGLKTGVGLVVDLGQAREVSAVDLALVGAPTDVSLYVTDEAPTGVAGLTPVATGTADDEALEVVLDRPTAGRYVVVWLTSLPPADGRFRGSVAEVVVRGA